ncbi:calcium-binding protein [uncultured Roseobacter sp.]|uniref:EF-hand domain-containing protein n=1 Tax=uncultured Roseobacter sp. TaxID=114847 RepID=UPI002616E0DE|nr:calcium-binding protein [uncultured Roseobacter sp.]
MKYTAFIAIILAGAVSVTTGVAMARDGGDREAADFETLDTDGDGQITRAEADALRIAHMSEADTDGDGFLSQAEIEARGAERMRDRSARMIERLDADKDGKLSMEELTSSERADRRFERADKNGDGVVSKEEFEEARANFRGRHKGKGRNGN